MVTKLGKNFSGENSTSLSIMVAIDTHCTLVLFVVVTDDKYHLLREHGPRCPGNQLVCPQGVLHHLKIVCVLL